MDIELIERFKKTATKLDAVSAIRNRSRDDPTSVKVCVRVRPFIPEELVRGEAPSVCVHVPTTQIVDIVGHDGKVLHYAFDRVFWSHSPNHALYATQETLYEELGSSMLENVVDGYNTCLFAYGQTGSGKSYSVLGDRSGPGRGLLPRVVDGFFEHVEVSPTVYSCSCTVSCLEIYNDQLYDLLSNSEEGGPELAIRQHPILGAIVYGLTDQTVSSKKEVMKVLDRGLRQRTVGETLMNKQSSRSHCIFTFKTSVLGEDGMAKMSRTHLVDLAGSERADRTGASGTRLKEGVAINSSLSTLGRVISTLAENCGKTKKQRKLPPFRDSKLTKVLKESLSGNSKTVMIAAISPSLPDCDETLGTLRFAQSATQVQLKAVTNEVSPAQEGAFARKLSAELAGMRERLATEVAYRPLDLQRFKDKARELRIQRELCKSAGITLDGLSRTPELSPAKLKHTSTFLEIESDSSSSGEEYKADNVAALLPLEYAVPFQTPVGWRSPRGGSSLAVVGPAAHDLLSDGAASAKERAEALLGRLQRLRKLAHEAEVDFGLQGRLQLRVCVAVDPEDLGHPSLLVAAEPEPELEDPPLDSEWLSEQELRDRLCWLWDSGAEAHHASWRAAANARRGAPAGAAADAAATVDVAGARTGPPAAAQELRVVRAEADDLRDKLEELRVVRAEADDLRDKLEAAREELGRMSDELYRTRSSPLSPPTVGWQQWPAKHDHQLEEPASHDGLAQADATSAAELARVRQETEELRYQLLLTLRRLEAYETGGGGMATGSSPSPSLGSSSPGGASGHGAALAQQPHSQQNSSTDKELSRARAEAHHLRRKQRETQRELSEIVLMSTRMVHAASAWRSSRE